jgi:Domain of unknown function (DUF4440)
LNKRQKKLTVCALLWMSALEVAYCQEQSRDSLRIEMEKRYAQMKIAMDTHDGKAIAALLAPGFVSENVTGGIQGSTEIIQGVQALSSDPGKVSETTLLSINQSADSVVVDQQYHMTRTKTFQTGEKQAIELVTLSTDTWVKSGGEWLMKRTQTNQLDYSQDGVVVAHKVRAPTQ